MQLKAEGLAAHLDRELRSIYLVSGDEPLQCLECAEAIRDAARSAGHAEREILETGRGFDWQQLTQQAQSLSLFGDRRLIDLRMKSAKPGRDGGAALSTYAKQPPEDTVLLITMPRLDRQQQSSAWFKAIDKTGVCIRVWPVDAAALPGWVGQRLRRNGIQPAPGVSELIAQQVEGNLLAAAQEIEKLLLLFGESAIDVDQVLAASSDSSRFDPFLLSDAAMSGDSARAVRILRGLRAEGLAAPQLLWALTRDLRLLDQVLQQAGGGLDQAISAAGVWPKRKASVRSAAGRLRPAHVLALLSLCQQADAACKGADPADPWQLIERVVLGVCGKRLSTRATA